jgi:hypothetical protein
MKKLLTIAGLLLITWSMSTAQSPVPDPSPKKNPIKEGDPAPQIIIPPKNGYQKTMVVVKPSQVPVPVRKRLEHSAYKGWEKATIYRNESSSIYLIEFREPGRIRKYRFDKNGQQLEQEDQY